MSKSITGIVAWLKNWFYDETEIDGFITTLNNSIGSKLNANLTEANKNVVTDGSGNVVLENKPVIPDVSGKIDTAGTGLSKSGTTLNHSNSVTAQSTKAIYKVKHDAQGHITESTAITGSDLPSHTHYATDVYDYGSSSYTNIGINYDDARQDEINNAINNTIGNLQNIRAIEITSDKGTASASTMGKLYIVSETITEGGESKNVVNVYYTERSGTSPNYTYTWKKMDTDILDEYSVAWNDVTDKPSSFPPSTHIQTATTVTDSNAHGNIGSSANANQGTINTAIDTALGNKASSSHTHGQVTNDGKITSTAVTVASGDNIVITDASDSSKIKRVANLLASHIKDGTAHSNIGSSANDTQATINSAIDTALSGKASASDVITSIALVPKATDSSGKIIFYTGDEPS